MIAGTIQEDRLNYNIHHFNRLLSCSQSQLFSCSAIGNVFHTIGVLFRTLKNFLVDQINSSMAGTFVCWLFAVQMDIAAKGFCYF